MVALSSYWASVGVRVDNKDLSKVDAYLAKIENKLKQGINNSKVAFTPKINIPAFQKHIRSALRSVGAGDKNALRVNVRVSESNLRKSIEKTTLNKPVDIKVSAKLDPNSLAGIKDQLKKALSNLVINARLGNVLGRTSAVQHRSPQKQNTGIATGDALSNAQLNTIRRQIARGGVGNSNSPEYWSQLAKLQVKTQQELLSQMQKMKGDPKYSWSPNPSGRGGTTPHLAEWLAGRPDKSSLSAANRRYSDVIMNQGFFGPSGAPNTLRGFAGETALGGLGRAGSSTFIGRGLSGLGSALGGARLGAVGLIAGAALKGVTSVVSGVWSSLGKMVSVPFQLIGSASSAVTGAFYRIALAAAPLLIAFNGIDRQVREQTLQGVALGSMASKYGSDLQTEREWLMNMSNRDGVEYASIIQPFTSFLSASAPAMGFDRSKSIFEALTQYGLTHGANDYSMQNALKAFGQMSGKGTVQLEELKNQVGDAQGFGGMMPIFAEAWQQVLGRTGKSAKTGDVAIKELLDATQKGQVISAKILPLVEEIARRESATGLEVMRQSSNAGRARFMNTMKEGWINFTEGGGERAIKNFWDDMTGSLGQWFKENGAWLGKRFELFVQDLKLLRIGITDTFKYLWTGENTSFVTWLAQEKGIDLSQVRVFLNDFWTGLKSIVLSVATAIGIIDEQTGEVNFSEFGDRLRNFGKSVSDAISSVMEMFSRLAKAFEISMEIFRGGMGEVAKSFVPGTDAHSKRMQMNDLVLQALGSGIDATISAGKGLAAPFLPSTSSLYQSPVPQFVSRDYSLVSPTNTFPASRLEGTSGFSGAPLRKKYVSKDVLANPGTGFKLDAINTLSASSALPVPESAVRRNAAPFGLEAQKLPPLDVNVKVQVSGDPDQMKLYVTDEVARSIADSVPKMVDYSFNGKLRSALPEASQN